MSKPKLYDAINAVNAYWHISPLEAVETINNADRCMYLSLCIMQRAGVWAIPEDTGEEPLWFASLVAESFIRFGHREMYEIDPELYGHLYNLTCALGIERKASEKVLREWETGTAPSAMDDGRNLKLLAQIAILNVPLNGMKLPDGVTIENVQEAIAEGLCA